MAAEVPEVFNELVGRHRRELLAHCYRMLGSVDEAEDAVQETFLRAWRAYAGFEGRSSERTWLYRIATNVCLTAIGKRGRRPLPSGLGAPADDPSTPLETGTEVPWLQPFPDALLAAPPSDPAAVTSARAGIRLAFVAALQQLSARQRAILILRDVLGMPAAEVAELLETTATAVNSGLRRAREQLARSRVASDDVSEPVDTARRVIVERFAAAVEAGDASAMAELLREDIVLEMPPFLTWFAGRDVVTEFVESSLLGARGELRLVPTGANAQPAFIVYRRVDEGLVLHALQVLELDDAGIARITAFSDPEDLAALGLPAFLAG
ncbi:sigma-70 family RNA polymerase sigma factor [Intrasporangium mesophilum]